MGWGASSPAVGFFGGEGFAVIGLDVTPLGLAEPEVVALQQGVDVAEVCFGCFGILKMGASDGFEGVGT